MNEQLFWSIIDDAWTSNVDLLPFRQDILAMLDSSTAREKFDAKYGNKDPLIPNVRSLLTSIQRSLDLLSKDELHQFDMIMERKLYDIDRQEIHEHTDGSDDGFLYCRGFIVAIGKTYYDAVNRDPTHAMYDWECEEITYISWHLYTEKFGDMPRSGISRESFSNNTGWQD